MLEFLNQPLNGTSSLILVVVLVAVIFIAIKLGHKKARYLQAVPVRTF